MNVEDSRAKKPADPINRLVSLLSRLPGIGEKTAMRLSLALIRSSPEYIVALANSIREIHSTIRMCEICCDLTSEVRCNICSDPKRDPQLICVVSQAQDRIAIERSSAHRGLYHVLHGVLDPLAGIGPEQLQIASLLKRLEESTIREVIVATSPNIEGDATALYLARLIGPLQIRVSRIASGVAVGGELEYADISTLHRALEDRRTL